MVGLACLDYVQNSSLCTGISLPEGESIQALVPHVRGSFKDLGNENMPKTTITFSAKCKIFAVSGASCSECNYLLKLHNRKTQRREKRMGISRNCNKRYLTKEDVVLQLNQERKQRLNAEKREKYWKEKFLEESVQLEDGDHADLTTMLRTVPKENIPEELECLWEQQQKILTTRSKRGYRWHPKLYKNKIEEKPGWNDEVLQWCLQTATHVLQFIFISDSGFRFAVAQFPSGECSPSDLCFNFWKGVRKMLEFGFVIYWCILDRAECNRQFVKLHFNGRDLVADKFIATNIHSGTPMDQKSFSLPLHEKLTDQHFNLDPASKMRNHLAEDVLDDKMPFLMQ
ncbi:hypothetical protein P5673_022469, partial [Acropora cervicornis]